MATTQDGRQLIFASPLGKDFLLIKSFRAVEGLSSLFSLELELIHDNGDDRSDEPVVVEPNQIIGQNITLQILQPDGTERFWNGLVAHFWQGSRDSRFSYYRAKIVPQLWLLTQISQSRIFQHLSVPDILKKVFEGFEVSWEIQGTFEKRNYCLQYRESDFDFASRLMEEEGIYYYFTHKNGSHKLTVANTPQSHADCESKSDIAFREEVASTDEFESAVNTWFIEHQLQTGKTTLWDAKFELPYKKLNAEKLSRFNVGNNQKLERYDYPGNYAKRFDGIDKSGGEQASELQKIFTDSTRTVEIRQQEIDALYKIVNGSSDCCSLNAGNRFDLKNHPNRSQNGLHVLVNVEHFGKQSPVYESGESVDDAYYNHFTCMPFGAGHAPYRSASKTPKPIIYGSQTAFVVGPAGEEIFTDKYGRVKVQFQWDREGQTDASSSCWIRVAQGWAGKNWGTMFIPRIGMEVIVDFLEGDPDQPIITGCVYNAETMPPYKLPDEKTKMTIKSDSSKGGGGFNEFRFEDKKGSEQIFVHGEKDIDIRIKNDAMELIKNDRHLIVENNQLEKVKKDKHLKVGGDRNEAIDGSFSLKVGADVDEKAAMKYAVEAGTEIHLKSGTNLTLETGTNLTLKVGGNFISINAGGIFIKGTMVMINSGGAAGSGSGSSPDAPEEAKEADNAKPGQSPKLPKPAPPPAKPAFISPAAMVMINAAQSGKAFCEICSKQSSPDLPMPVKTNPVPPEKKQESAPSPVVAEENQPASAPVVSRTTESILSPAVLQVNQPVPLPVAPLEKKQEDKKAWIEIVLLDTDGKPVPNVLYRITPPAGGTPQEGRLNEHGQAGLYQIEPGECKISFPELDKDAWE